MAATISASLTIPADDSQAWAVTWTAREPMQRSSHALEHGGRVWLIDPVADQPALRRAEAMGEVVAVLQLLDRHPRDCGALAQRYGVPHLRLPEALPDSPFELRRMLWVPRWRELALWWPEHRALVVAEAVGTGPYFALGGRPLGVHPFLRAKPPGPLREFEPEHLLVGHGAALHGGAASALTEALQRSRRDIPRVIPAMLRASSTGHTPG